MTFRFRHLLAALVLHALLIGLLGGGLQCTRKPVRPPVIQAVLLDPDRKQTAQQKRADEQRRKQAELERKRQEADARRKVEQEQQRREADEKKQLAEAEKKRLAEEKKKVAEAEKKRVAEETQRKKAEDQQRQKELAEQKKAEDLARRKQAELEKREQQDQARREIQEKARMEQELQREAAELEAARAQDAQAATERERETAEWAAALERHVQRHWLRPAAVNEDFECTVRVQQLPDGNVTSAQIQKTCGNAPLDRSVEDAVYRASPLPRPSNPAVFDRDLIIHFVPNR